MKHLKKFESNDLYIDYKDNSLVLPNVSYVEDINTVFYNPFVVLDPTIKVYAVSADDKLIDYNIADETAKGIVLHATGNNFDKKFMIAKKDVGVSRYGTVYWEYSCMDHSLTNYTTVDGTNEYGYLPYSSDSYDGTPHLSPDFTTWTEGAISDSNGKANTAAIIADYAEKGVSLDRDDMCSVLNAFNAGTSSVDNGGFNDWYIPSLGQLSLMFLVRDEIYTAFRKINGGEGLISDEYWSSTEYDADRGWHVDFKYGDIDTAHKDTVANDSGLYVRFIRDI